MEMYAFCHFTVDNLPTRNGGAARRRRRSSIRPAFDANQIVGALKSGGLKGSHSHLQASRWILPLAHQDHDAQCFGQPVSRRQGRRGPGDVEACKKAGMKFGVYVSPWDRNNPLYGTPEYVTNVYREQIRELCTNYGPIFEIWFDGANGGTGYYGGKGGSRGHRSQHLLRLANDLEDGGELQPGAIIFSDVGPDWRWCGNESGGSGDPAARRSLCRRMLRQVT